MRPKTAHEAAGEETIDALAMMTVSYANLEASAGLGERLSAKELVEVLNRHFSLQAEAVQEQGGYVDKVFGMALQAFWGPPFMSEDKAALLASQAAIKQLRAMNTLSASFPEFPQMHLSIGISTGRVVAGHLGPLGFRRYSVIGDTVNFCQWLQGANRLYGTHILMDEETCKRAGTAIVAREIDVTMVKGRKNPVRIFELSGAQDEVSEA